MFECKFLPSGTGGRGENERCPAILGSAYDGMQRRLDVQDVEQLISFVKNNSLNGGVNTFVCGETTMRPVTN
ncbi:hypothetical protein O9992_08760 [Vibrio lentus]|nr:hypothetical protein [Vibrio lentus]